QRLLVEVDDLRPDPRLLCVVRPLDGQVQAGHGAGQTLDVERDRQIDAGRVAAVEPGKYLQHRGAVPCRARHRTDVVQAEAVERAPIFRHSTVGRLNATDTAKRRRTPDTSPG